MVDEPVPQQADALAPTASPDYKTNPVNPNTGMQPYANTPFPSAAGAVASSTSGQSVFANGENKESSAFETGAKFSLEAVGNSGTQIFGGYFSEEYLSSLRGRNGAKKWDEMRRSESQIAMLMNATTNPIKAAEWSFEAYDESDPNFVLQKELVKTCLTEMVDFVTFKHEALTMLPFGFSILEVVHSIEYDHPKFGTFNGLKALAFRSQKTIENWVLQPKTGKLLGVNQYTYSDLGGNQFIPGEFLLVFSHLKEGDNYEGISVLRPMFGPYVRKNLYLQLAAIGIERYAIGTPIGTVPSGREKDTDVAEFKKVLQNYTSHESSYIVKPEGWEIEIQKGDFDAAKIKELLAFENTEFANAIVANFLALGMNGGGGAYALGANLAQFFTTGIQAYADLICDAVNRQLIPNLVKLNFGPQRGYPKMKVTGISDKAGKELAETLKSLADSRLIVPDMPLREFLRQQYRLPKEDQSTAVATPALPKGAENDIPKPGEAIAVLREQTKSIQLADKQYVAKFDANKEKLKSVMQDNLAMMYGALKDSLRRKYNGLSGTDKVLAAKGVSMPGLNAYKAALREQLALVAEQSIASARKLVPAAKKVKLASKWEKLPPRARKIVDIQATLLGETQAADIEKVVFFQFTSAATASEDIDEILFEVDSAVKPVLEGSTGSGMSVDAAAANAVAHVTQESAMTVYQDPEVEESIESYTFTNEDPKSDICTELEGTTFAPDDPDLARYSPPLHHNCKSRLVPNIKGDSGNPEVDRAGVSLTKKALDAITLGECCR